MIFILTPKSYWKLLWAAFRAITNQSPDELVKADEKGQSWTRPKPKARAEPTKTKWKTKPKNSYHLALSDSRPSNLSHTRRTLSLRQRFSSSAIVTMQTFSINDFSLSLRIHDQPWIPSFPPFLSLLCSSSAPSSPWLARRRSASATSRGFSNSRTASELLPRYRRPRLAPFSIGCFLLTLPASTSKSSPRYLVFVNFVFFCAVFGCQENLWEERKADLKFQHLEPEKNAKTTC